MTWACVRPGVPERFWPLPIVGMLRIAPLVAPSPVPPKPVAWGSRVPIPLMLADVPVAVVPTPETWLVVVAPTPVAAPELVDAPEDDVAEDETPP